MPIITEKYSDTRYGFLQGLGAAAAAPAVPMPDPNVRKMLVDPKTGKFSNSMFESYKQYLISAKDQAWKDYAAIQQKVNSVGRTSSSTVKDAAEKLKSSTVLPMTAKRLTSFTDQLAQVWDPNGAFWDNPAGYESILRGFRTEIANLQSDASTLGIASDMSFYTALGNRAAVMLKESYDYGVKVAKNIKETIEAVAGGAGAAIRAPFDFAKWLSDNALLLVGGGVVVFFVLPTLLKSGAAYKRGGSAAALETAAGDIEGTRRAIGSGARAVGSGVKKAGSFAITKNPAALLSGAPKRRVSRRGRR